MEIDPGREIEEQWRLEYQFLLFLDILGILDIIEQTEWHVGAREHEEKSER